MKGVFFKKKANSGSTGRMGISKEHDDNERRVGGSRKEIISLKFYKAERKKKPIREGTCGRAYASALVVHVPM